MKRNLNCLLILIFAMSSQVLGEVKTFQLDKAKIHLDLPEGWAGYKKMIGLPLVVTGPQKTNSRLILSITPTSIKEDNSLNFNSAQYKSYIAGRKKWVKEKGGSVNKIFKYKQTNWKNIKNVHVAGYRYTLASIQFEEYSYYLHCNKSLFHIKSLRRIKEFPKGHEDFNNILQSFNCR